MSQTVVNFGSHLSASQAPEKEGHFACASSGTPFFWPVIDSELSFYVEPTIRMLEILYEPL